MLVCSALRISIGLVIKWHHIIKSYTWHVLTKIIFCTFCREYFDFYCLFFYSEEFSSLWLKLEKQIIGWFWASVVGTIHNKSKWKYTYGTLRVVGIVKWIIHYCFFTIESLNDFSTLKIFVIIFLLIDKDGQKTNWLSSLRKRLCLPFTERLSPLEVHVA